MKKQFHIDIITPTSIESFDNVSYLRIPSLEGLIGVQANHAQAVIGLDVGEIKITKDDKDILFATSGGFADIAKEGVQLLLETSEKFDSIDLQRAEASLNRAQNRMSDQSTNLARAEASVKRAQNRLRIIKKMS
tara:strand:+ start:660 stop:1061 length:402 start_codon:yes stop_codon:yes gene_type:complete